MGGLAPCPTPNQEGLGFLSGCPSLSHNIPLFERHRIPAFCRCHSAAVNCITRVMTRTCDSRLGGRAFDTVGISWHLRSTPGGTSALHQGPLPIFNTMRVYLRYKILFICMSLMPVFGMPFGSNTSVPCDI